jgi:hypothetical protein
MTLSAFGTKSFRIGEPIVLGMPLTGAKSFTACGNAHGGAHSLLSSWTISIQFPSGSFIKKYLIPVRPSLISGFAAIADVDQVIARFVDVSDLQTKMLYSKPG